MNELILTAQQLQNAIELIVRQGGSTPREAELVACNLVEANLTGHDSHGAGMVPRYVLSLQEGMLSVNQHPSTVLDTGSILRLDGNKGYGQVIGFEAMQLGIERAKVHGVCVVALANSHHLGRIGHWAEQCAAAGLVSLHFVNVVSRPIVAPFGGSDARLGTNPVCIGVPRDTQPPIILDFATSRIAQGKARVAHNKGVPVEPERMLDNQGHPTTNPSFAVVPPFGAILPFGEHKGYGLALMAELLGGALAGGPSQYQAPTWPLRVLNGMLSIILDPTSIGTADYLQTQTDAFSQWTLQSPPLGDEAVQLPGDPERKKKQARLKQGIPMDATTWQEILDAAGKLGLQAGAVAEAAGL